MTYIPCIKSKLWALKAVGASAQPNVIPLIDLCSLGRNRGSSKFGDVNAAVAALAEQIGSQDFFLDVSDHPSDSVLSHGWLVRPENAYENWVNFVSQNFSTNCFPIIQFTPDDASVSLKKQVKQFLNRFSNIGVRLPIWVEYDEIKELNVVLSAPEFADRITLFVDIKQFNDDQFRFCEQMDDWSPLNDFKVIQHLADMSARGTRPRLVPISSSFPRGVVPSIEAEVNNAGFCSGERELTDIALWKYLVQRFGNLAQIEYGDYAGMNQNEATGSAAWIPRVDIPEESSFSFFRQRTRSNKNAILTGRGLDYSALPDNNAEALVIICRYIANQAIFERMCSDEARSIIRAAARGRPQRADAGFWSYVRMLEHIARYAELDNLTA